MTFARDAGHMRTFITVLVLLEAAGFTLFASMHVAVAAIGAVLLFAGVLRLTGSEFADVATLGAVAVAIGAVLAGVTAGGLYADALNRAALLSLMATGLFQLTTPSWLSTTRSTAAVRIRR